MVLNSGSIYAQTHGFGEILKKNIFYLNKFVLIIYMMALNEVACHNLSICA